ncbi:kanadaptin [Rhizophagus clarus]|uniref:Kanadaptin n=1 Tax=Rhizophagus clarus TaxID=94130 RepID=A0A8H3LE31_9GLOM|nr:kanadaptin [Rhizophagus clarus]
MENNIEETKQRAEATSSDNKQTGITNSLSVFKAPLPVKLKERQQKQQQQQQHLPIPPPVPYEKPEWSDLPKDNYSFEIIKNGVSLELIDFPSKEFLVLGRLPICDIAMEHPSVSRYHATIQFNSKGEIFLYDLDSAHGTIINKQRIPSRHFTKLRVGDQLKFGESTRTYVLLGPEESQPEPPESIQISKSISKPVEGNSSVTWGFAEDAEDESEMNVTATKELWKLDENAYYYKDPKKALRNWLENRGYDMEFECEQEGPGHSRIFTARIRLPDVEDAYGPVYGLGNGSKRKDAERQAAIDSCEKLDMLGLLRASQDEASARKKRMRELLGDDDNDDDYDSFYDRTGQAERAKLRKIQPQKVETYESLTRQREELTIKIKEIRSKISNAKEFEKSSPIIAAEDDLDSYMNTINKDLNSESVTNLEATLRDLLKQDLRLAKLIEITKPLDIMQGSSMTSSLSKSNVANSNTTIVEPKIKANVKRDIPILSSDKFKIPISVNTERSDSDDDDLSLIPSKKSSDNKISQKRQNFPDKEEINNEKEKRIKTMIPMTPQEYEIKQRKAEELNELEIEDVTAWEPPKDQTGDGRTALNDKYGY